MVFCTIARKKKQFVSTKQLFNNDKQAAGCPPYKNIIVKPYVVHEEEELILQVLRP